MVKMANIVIFICDSLRYDVACEKYQLDFICSLASCNSTMLAVPSILSGIQAFNINIGNMFPMSYFETDKILNESFLTLFDLYLNKTYYDCIDDAMKIVFSKKVKRENIELSEIEPPFIYVERLMETHHPYNVMSHGNILPVKVQYNISPFQNASWHDYLKGVDNQIQHVYSHLDTLKERGLWDKSIIVLTADHGEEVQGGKHEVLTDNVFNVPVYFFNPKVNNVRYMRNIDIAPTILNMLQKEKMLEPNGVNILQNKVPSISKAFYVLKLYNKIVKFKYEDIWRLMK